jgi:hypothetical protein
METRNYRHTLAQPRFSNFQLPVSSFRFRISSFEFACFSIRFYPGVLRLQRRNYRMLSLHGQGDGVATAKAQRGDAAVGVA